MTHAAPPGTDQQSRELEFLRSEYNALGARMLRLQEQLSQVTREARRSKIVARLVREAYALGHQALSEAQVGEPILGIVADTAICDEAMFLHRDPHNPELFQVLHAVGLAPGATLEMADPPPFLFTSAAHEPHPLDEALQRLIGLPFMLWAYNKESGAAVLLGKRIEGNIHRPFEAGDREIVEVALAVYEDVCLHKRAEATLRHAKQVAEEASEARARFLANLSHELRTPLNSIVGFAKLLNQLGLDGAPADESQEYVRLILDAGQGLNALARDILDFSAITHARPILRMNWLPVAYLLSDAARAVRATAQAAGVRLEAIAPEPGLEALLDYDRFRQILANILGNALKFTPAGGTVSISAVRDADAGLQIAVQDTGIGIREEDLPRVLEPFIQLDEHAIGGAGLGLPIAIQLVEAHGGKMRLVSRPGEGTTVFILLPAQNTRMSGA